MSRVSPRMLDALWRVRRCMSEEFGDGIDTPVTVTSWPPRETRIAPHQQSSRNALGTVCRARHTRDRSIVRKWGKSESRLRQGLLRLVCVPTKGLQDLARGFNLVSTPGNRPPGRRRPVACRGVPREGKPRIFPLAEIRLMLSKMKSQSGLTDDSSSFCRRSVTARRCQSRPQVKSSRAMQARKAMRAASEL
jgi:hypothetical protein